MWPPSRPALLSSGPRRLRSLARELEDHLGEARGALMKAVERGGHTDTPLWISTPLEEALRVVSMARMDEEHRREIEGWIRWCLDRVRGWEERSREEGTGSRGNGRSQEAHLAARLGVLAQRAGQLRGGDRLHLPLRPGAEALLHRVERGAEDPGPLLLRPPGFGGPAGGLHCHCPGTRCLQSTGSTWPGP